MGLVKHLEILKRSQMDWLRVMERLMDLPMVKQTKMLMATLMVIR
jgi:hypothetical protein